MILPFDSDRGVLSAAAYWKDGDRICIETVWDVTHTKCPFRIVSGEDIVRVTGRETMNAAEFGEYYGAKALAQMRALR